jgi:hypothetical protein
VPLAEPPPLLDELLLDDELLDDELFPPLLDEEELLLLDEEELLLEPHPPLVLLLDELELDDELPLHTDVSCQSAGTTSGVHTESERWLWRHLYALPWYWT